MFGFERLGFAFNDEDRSKMQEAERTDSDRREVSILGERLKRAEQPHHTEQEPDSNPVDGPSGQKEKGQAMEAKDATLPKTSRLFDHLVQERLNLEECRARLIRMTPGKVIVGKEQRDGVLRAFEEAEAALDAGDDLLNQSNATENGLEVAAAGMSLAHDLVVRARETTNDYEDYVIEARTGQKKRRMRAEHASTELANLLTDLSANPALASQHATFLAQLKTQVHLAKEAIESGRFHIPVEFLESATAQARQLIIASADQQAPEEEPSTPR